MVSGAPISLLKLFSLFLVENLIAKTAAIASLRSFPTSRYCHNFRLEPRQRRSRLNVRIRQLFFKIDFIFKILKLVKLEAMVGRDVVIVEEI